MASVLKVDTITGVTTAGSVAVTGEGNSTTTNLQQGLAKVLISINCSGTAAANDSFNVTSITDNAAGDMSIAITNNMGNSDYIMSDSSGYVNNWGNGNFFYEHSAARSTSAYRHYSFTQAASSGVATDTPTLDSVGHGDLA